MGGKKLKKMVQPVNTLPVVEETVRLESGDTDTQMLVVLFRLGNNHSTRRQQVKGKFTTYPDGKPLFVHVIPDVDAEQQPRDGEIWVVEASRNPIDSWNHENSNDGTVTPCILVSAVPVMQIMVPEQVRFSDFSPRGNPCCKVREALPDGTRVAFVADRKGEQPAIGETWSVVPSYVLQHRVGPNEVVVITCFCERRMVLMAQSATALAFAQAGTWKPSSKVGNKVLTAVES
jgi:hypothetical protein